MEEEMINVEAAASHRVCPFFTTGGLEPSYKPSYIIMEESRRRQHHCSPPESSVNTRDEALMLEARDVAVLPFRTGAAVFLITTGYGSVPL
ncbi:hypothetical protein DY000_02056077 [Brassica cretica]|uniref:Uncharacterized protein n=1 Tax=Brassica cretica TaxID=69181 RepID=A0ABQ7AGE0_BRACR|nr:hypothetical protein DY000_02056077 [Brassica cretica]